MAITAPWILALLFVAGYLLKFVPKVPKDLYQKVNQFIIFLPLPAITLLFVPKLEIGRDALIPVASAWFIYMLAIPVFYILKRIFSWNDKTFAALVLVCGLGNTSFIGYPILSLLYGADSIQYGILVDQSTFVLLSTVGVIWATSFGFGKPDLKNILLRLLKFPPFLVFIAAFFIPWSFLEPYEKILSATGSLMVPLAIFSIGMQFRFLLKEINYGAFISGLFFKLILAPSLIFIILFWILKKEGLMFDVTFIECAMPPMITASIIANKYNLEGDLSNALVTYGIPASFVTLWMWSSML